MLAALLLALTVPREARADDPPADPPRAVPDYRGRPAAPPSVGESLLWIPRVLLFPVYALTEYGVRIPLAYTTTAVERSRIVDRLDRLMHPLPGLTVRPSFVVDLGMVSSVGLHITWDDAIARDNRIMMYGATGGPGYWRAQIIDAYTFAERSRIGISGEYYERADWRFYGIGPLTFERNEQRFDWGRIDGHFFLDWNALHHLGISLTAGIRHDQFGAPFLAPYMPNMQFPIPGYYNHGTVYGEARIFADSRHPGSPTMTGARLEGAATAASQTQFSTDQQWVGAELEGSVFIEVKHPGRVLGLRTYAAIVDPLGRSPIPFVDLITLGGFESMQGWYWGRFRGESTALLSATYRYPVWYFLDGMVFAEVGNVFGHHFEGFDVRHLYGSAGIGFRTTGVRDTSFQALLAFGTSRFDEPFEVRSVHLAFGINRGF